MRKLMAAIGLLALVAAVPARAGTLEEITTHGMVITLGDMDIDLTFTPDGKFSGLDGQITGTWKIDGDKMCTTSNFDPNETCAVYPKDKKSGDSFDLTGPQGTAKVKIK
ncbi:MAG TPA: hypothetical protein VHN39_03950 [Phenylobacterium sp.]|jgi:hypothetical protein|nr:hypothetical protein [Phenylobacterium sp.]